MLIAFKPPNAGAELLPEAGAERTLEAVSSRPLLGCTPVQVPDENKRYEGQSAKSDWNAHLGIQALNKALKLCSNWVNVRAIREWSVDRSS